MGQHVIYPAQIRNDKDWLIPGRAREEIVSFRTLYGETADNMQGLLDKIYPDMGRFCNMIAYGSVYSMAVQRS
jgi:hypothetical protein